MKFQKPVIYAHRGFSGIAPENTVIAFRKALEVGATGIELDVQLSKDGEIMVIHDEKIDRTTNGKGLVIQYTKDELQQFDAGSWLAPEFAGAQIPTLREVLELLRNTPIQLNIEFKTGVVDYEGLEEKTLRLVKHYRYENQTLYSSFNHYSLVKVKSLDHKARIGLLYVAGLYEPWDYARKLGADAIHPLYYSARPELVVAAHASGIEVNTYTVDMEADLRNVLLAGVDGIITNYPDRLLKILQEA